MKKLGVSLIIGLIVLFFAKTLFSANFDNEIRQVKATILKVELGLKRYRIVNNTYPEDGNRNLVFALHLDYITFQSQEIGDGLLLDLWGHPYIYRRYDPGDNLRWHTYVIYSVGPNGIDEDGNGDDIGNW